MLEQPFEAAEAWRNLLEVDPTDFEAMEELEKGYRSEERWAEVVDVKMRRAQALAEPAEQIRELLEVTQIWKKEVNDYDKATAAFERVLEIDPAHDEAFDALERLHTAGERWEQLVELYLNRLETRETTEDKNDLLRRIARVFEEKLEDKNQSFDALVNAFAEDFGDDESVRYLEKMAAATGRWGELINTANAWLQEQTEPKKKIQLCLRLGKWYGEDLGHPEYAQPYYGQVMQLDPNNVQVLRQMAAIYRLGAQWQKMGETLTRALDVAVANDDKKVILCDLGELLEKHMNQADQGITFYKRALDVDGLFLPALEALERIYDERGNHAELVQILTSKVKALTDTDQIAQHKMRLGGLYETALGDFERAGKVYREVLELDGSSIYALRGLERIYQALLAWPDMVDVLERQLDVVETERERVDVLLKLAQIQEEQFLKADAAAQRLEQALEIDPSCESAYVALERCYRRLKQWLDLINTYERHIARGGGSADQGRALRRHGRGLRRGGWRRRSRHRRVPKHRRPRRKQHRGARCAGQALRKAGRCGTVHRCDDASRRSHDRRHPARRDVLPHRQGPRREARRPSRRRKSASRWRSISTRRTYRRWPRCVSSPSTSRTGTAPRATSSRSSSIPRPPVRARSFWSSSASCATRC